MRFIEKIKLIERIDQMIRMKATGSSRELAKKVGVSKSTLYDILGIMRSMGAEINYCTCRKTYYYENKIKLNIGYKESKNFSGGRNKMSTSKSFQFYWTRLY